MAKKMTSALGVHKTRIVKRKKSNKYGVMLRNVIDYLKSDCYLFAPLFSSHSSDFSPPKSTSSSISYKPTGVDTGELFEEENNKTFAAKVVEYMKSDDYMYAPLLLHQQSLSSDNIKTSPQLAPEGVAVPKTPASDKENEKRKEGVAAAKTPALDKENEKRKQPTKQSAKIPRESDSHPVARTVVKHTVSCHHEEAVKHIVHKHCLSSPLTGFERKTRGSRNVVVE